VFGVEVFRIDGNSLFSRLAETLCRYLSLDGSEATDLDLLVTGRPCSNPAAREFCVVLPLGIEGAPLEGPPNPEAVECDRDGLFPLEELILTSQIKSNLVATAFLD
jgi:hypothetical protein